MEIQIYPHPVLRYKSKPICRINKELRRIVGEMFALMYQQDGIGLAANQVGLPLQLFVVNTSGDAAKTNEEFVLINPVIQRRKGNEEDEEGCLSFPDVRAKVIRSAKLEIEGISLAGEPQSFAWDGMLARAAQHELDHLSGVAFIDRLTPTAFADVREDLEYLESVFARNQASGKIAPDAEIIKSLESIENQFC
ncbi:MAG: peptide deformylase [Thermoguttaceae bacterium]